jgi:periplasmic divalent cation tolerance protein
MTNIVLVLTTVADDETADRIAGALVTERIAACVTIGAAMTSVYWWQGKLTREIERPLTIKTTVARIAAVKARLIDLHSYELPEIIVIPVVEGSDSYLDWVRAGTTNETAGR